MLVGRYQLLFRLGKGGMGEVWAAAQTQSEFGFQKLIALKILRSRELTSNAAVMFMDEANAASVLQHQAIVSTVDLGQDDDILYIAMDMVRGPSLTALLQRLVINKRHMTPSMVAHIGLQIASALDYGHSRAQSKGVLLKMVHRDVSPHNVLLDLNGSVKLTDFGVARTAIQEHQSHVGTVRGKPSYMAPEQVAGADVDARTDVFALGIVLYESSCLKRLFGRSNPVKSMDAVVHHDPKPLLTLKPDFPEPMWHVIRRALEKDPEKRWQSAAEFRDALEEASRLLPDAASAPRDLVTLINKNFEAEAFDIESRVAEIREEIGPAPSPSQPGLPAPAVRPVEDSPVIRGVDVPPELGTKLAWPTAHAPDPLAPEAIEEARTQFRALTPSESAALGMQSLSVDLTPSVNEMTPLGTHSSVLVPPTAPRKRWLVPAAALTSAAALMAGTAFVVLSSRTTTTDSTPKIEKVEVPAEPPAAVATPGVQQKVARVQRKDPPPPPPAAPATDADKKTTTRRRPTKTTTTKRTPPPPPKAPPKKVADATYDEVRGLVNQVKKIDPGKAKSMYPTLIEAGRDNKALLNKLRREAKAIIAQNQ